VVLTGGIGITPFRSILVEAMSHGRLAHPVTVFHANRLPTDAAFIDELRALAEQDPNLTFVPTMTGEPSSTWDQERGRIDMSMVQRHAASLKDPIYYITGPGKMVEGLHAMLRDAGVTDEAIRTEEFTGY
jgi:ferredoxin-NADP reductase